MNGITEIPGILVGHASDYEALTGVTAILCPEGAVGGVDLRGAATGTEEIEVLRPQHVTERVHAVVLAGGSAFGLEAASGVRRYLAAQGIGYPTRNGKVPLVSAAILYDLGIGKPDVRPTREMGEAAARAASADPVIEGAIGAGTGATVGKLFGMERAMKSGVGNGVVALTGRYAGVKVAALTAVNAFGDVFAGGKIIAGARTSAEANGFVGAAAAMKAGAIGGLLKENTTLTVVATNARLNKVEATKLAQLAGLGMARAISPVNTMFDGDVVFALAVGTLRADVNALGVAAAEAVEESIIRAVQKAHGMGGVPGLSL